MHFICCLSFVSKAETWKSHINNVGALSRKEITSTNLCLATLCVSFDRLVTLCNLSPVGRRLPSSATTSHTRPMSQLDDALKQFRMSTAASRENLRNSRQNLDQMEEQVDIILILSKGSIVMNTWCFQVKVMIRSRPATPLLSLRRETEDSNKQISSSLQDLRS